MKKLYLLFIFALCIFMTGCASKEERTVKTLDDFWNASIHNGYIVNDNMINYEGFDYITGASIATQDDLKIEMVIYDNEKDAIKAQDGQIDTFKTLKGSGAVFNKEEGKNFYIYDMISNNYYTVSARVENTLVFSRAPVENKEKIETILKELEYLKN